MNKIIRTICYFTDNPSMQIVKKLDNLCETLTDLNFEIQTKRICSLNTNKIVNLAAEINDRSYIFGVGSQNIKDIANLKSGLYSNHDISFNLDLTDQQINSSHANLLFKMLASRPPKTFNFTFVFNNPPSSPFFPSATYKQNGFSIGLQSTDLSANCQTLTQWLNKMERVWDELNTVLARNEDYLGIDSSIAPLFSGNSSLLSYVKRLGYNFNHSATTDIYLKITQFIKHNNPKPIGLCGIMFPCLEDFELADEYSKGNFSIERNIFLSLHSGLGIDTYPIGMDESPKRVLEILKLVQALSNKYKKPLSVRFVSDGLARIGQKTNFKNQYLKDVIIKTL